MPSRASTYRVLCKCIVFVFQYLGSYRQEDTAVVYIAHRNISSFCDGIGQTVRLPVKSDHKSYDQTSTLYLEGNIPQSRKENTLPGEWKMRTLCSLLFIVVYCFNQLISPSLYCDHSATSTTQQMGILNPPSMLPEQSCPPT